MQWERGRKAWGNDENRDSRNGHGEDAELLIRQHERPFQDGYAEALRDGDESPEDEGVRDTSGTEQYGQQQLVHRL